MRGGQSRRRLAVLLAVVTTGFVWVAPSAADVRSEPTASGSAAEEVVFPGFEKAAVAADAAGGLVVAAVPSDSRAGLLARYRDPAGDWGPWVQLSGANEQDAEEVQVAAGPRGVAVVAWRAYARGHWRTFAKMRAPNGEWVQTRQLPIDVDWVRNNCGSRENEPQLAVVMNASGDAAVAVLSEYYRNGEDFTRKLRVFFRSAGGAWAERAEFEGVDYRFVEIDESGQLYIAFGEYGPYGEPAPPAHEAVRDVDGSWTDTSELLAGRAPIGAYAVDGDGRRFVLSWPEESGGEATFSQQTDTGGPLTDQFTVPNADLDFRSYSLAITANSKGRLAYATGDSTTGFGQVYLRAYDGESWGPEIVAGVDESGERRSRRPFVGLADDGRGLVTFRAAPPRPASGQSKYARLIGGDPDPSGLVTLDPQPRANYRCTSAAVGPTGDLFTTWSEPDPQGEPELHVRSFDRP